MALRGVRLGSPRSSDEWGVPAALAPTGVSVSHPKERLDGHALALYPIRRARLT